VRERRPDARALCVLDRDREPRPLPEGANEHGLEFFTWGRRHIESYLLVPDAIRRSLRLACDDVRIERFFRSELPTRDDEHGHVALDAKALFAHHGELQRLLGRPVRPVQVARAMRREELHADVLALLGRLDEALAVGTQAAPHRRRTAR
jgi:hypothetical protein